MLSTNLFLSPAKAINDRMIGHDFLVFYAAGTLVREGRTAEIYNLAAIRDCEQGIVRSMGLEAMEGKDAPWWNPPFYAWVFVPFSRLPYQQALALWMGINLAALAAAVILLARMLGQAGWRNWGLVPLLLAVSLPLMQVLTHGQNAFTSLLLLTVITWAWRKEQEFLAGMIAGLLFYKPQLAAVVSLVLVLDLGWSALAGAAVTGLALLGLTWLTMPGAIGDFLHQLPANLQAIQVDKTYLWERHVTWKAFWRLLLQGREAGQPTAIVQGLAMLCTAVFGIALLAAAVAGMRWRSAERRDWLIAATIATMPLLMPFYFDYDLLLLAIPAVLTVRLIQAGWLDPPQRTWLIRAWVALFIWLMFNGPIARRTHVNLTVLLLAFLAGLLIMRLLKGARRAWAPGARATTCVGG